MAAKSVPSMARKMQSEEQGNYTNALLGDIRDSKDSFIFKGSARKVVE